MRQRGWETLLTRRGFALLATGAAVQAVSCTPDASSGEGPVPGSAVADALSTGEFNELETTVRKLLTENSVPGFAGGLIKGGELVWAKGFGYADLETLTERTEGTIQNIGSVTKTATATVVFRLLEKGSFALDDDVNGLVDFSVRNPRHPEVPITIRQLLTHRSSILDGDAYGESYACGDGKVTLGEFLSAYFTEGDQEAVFHEWAPGTVDPPEDPRSYSNVAYGLLGHVIEKATGQSYEDALDSLLLQPLGMKSSRVLLAGMDPADHASLYSKIPEGFDPDAPDEDPLFKQPPWPADPEEGDLFAHCLYSFATPPDGLLRSNVVDLALLIRLYLGGGEVDGVRLLKEETVDMALSDQHFGRALCWARTDRPNGENFWNHSGGDPGVSTLVAFRREEKSAVIMLFNTSDAGSAFGGIANALIENLDTAGA